MQVLSKTVADAFSYEANSNLRETERFVRLFDRFFDCMNVRNFTEAIYQRKPDLRPYRRSDDPRLSVCSVILQLSGKRYHVFFFTVATEGLFGILPRNGK